MTREVSGFEDETKEIASLMSSTVVSAGSEWIIICGLCFCGSIMSSSLCDRSFDLILVISAEELEAMMKAPLMDSLLNVICSWSLVGWMDLVTIDLADRPGVLDFRITLWMSFCSWVSAGGDFRMILDGAGDLGDDEGTLEAATAEYDLIVWGEDFGNGLFNY